MAPFPAGELIRLWERGREQHPVDRALTLLEIADPPSPRNELASLRIGDRDRRLLELRRQIFGDQLDAEAGCPGCGQRVELAVSSSQLLAAETGEAAPPSVAVQIDGLEVEIRPADSRDLAAAAADGTVEEARRTLLQRCVIGVVGDAPTTSAELSERATDEISRVLGKLDPQAYTELDLICPECRETWRQTFDIGDFLWNEVVARVRSLLNDVHTLAWAYGWSEREVLFLSDARRRFYLEQVK